MPKPPASPPPITPARRATHRRARRGVVAAYIHELSARHAAGPRDPAPQPPVVPVLEPARST